MNIEEIAKAELIKMGMKPLLAGKMAKDMLIGFPKIVAEKYAQQKFIEGAAAQRVICSKTPLLTKYSNVGLELAKAAQVEILKAPEPDYK